MKNGEGEFVSYSLYTMEKNVIGHPAGFVTFHQPRQQGNNEHFHSAGSKGRKEMFYLMTHSTHFIYGYKASDIW